MAASWEWNALMYNGMMPRYLTQHTLAYLTRQGAGQLAARMASARGVTPRRAPVNMLEGKMLVEFDAV